MTSLIDVIFLLLLFFMLASTFSRYSEVELAAAGQGGAAPSERPPLFVQLAPADLRINGQSVAMEGLAELLGAEADPESPRVVLVALGREVTAQRLTDLLVALRAVPGIAPTVLGASS